MKLNLGCQKKINGYVNLDVSAGAECDIRADAEYFLPFKDASFDKVEASHILEHIHNLVQLQRELARVLKPGGKLRVTVPYYLSPDAWGDPTHCRAFSMQSFFPIWWPEFVGDGQNGDFEIHNILGKKKLNNEKTLWLRTTLIRRENGTIGTSQCDPSSIVLEGEV